MQGAPSRYDSLVRGFRELEFSFDGPGSADGPHSLRGFAPQAVVEVRTGPPTSLTLLLSTTEDEPSKEWSAACIDTLARTLGSDLSVWLAGQLRRVDLASPWRNHRVIGDTDVTVECLCAGAMLLMIEEGASAARSDESRHRVVASHVNETEMTHRGPN